MEALPIKEAVKDKVVIVGQKEIEKLKLQGTIRPQKGHTLFELNLKTKEIKPAQFEEIYYQSDMKKKKVIMQHDCIYISALNEKNALRKLFKSINK